MEAVASLFGGLGLFFLGIKGASGALVVLTGPGIRDAMARGTSTPWHAAALGLGLGAVTQSSNAVTFIIASLRSADLIAARRMLPLLAWANVGTAGLVLVATFDLRLAALWLLGLAGFATLFLAGGGRWRPLLSVMSSLGLMLLGLALVKLGAIPLRQQALVRALLDFADGALLPAFLVGALIALVAQSSSTVSILAIALTAAGLMTFDQAVATIYGASLGSGLAVWLLAGGLEGTARQPVLFQALLRGIGALLFLCLLLLERRSGMPLLMHLVGHLAREFDTQLALVFLALQAGPALLAAPLHRPIERLLAWLAPAMAMQENARPCHLYPQALEDAPSALVLVLVEAELARLLERLPHVLDPIRNDAAPACNGIGGTDRLEAEIGNFLAALLAQGLPPACLRAAVREQSRLGLLTALRETLADFVATAEPSNQAVGPLSSMVEALHLLLEELRDMAGQDAAQWLAELASDRGEIMQRQ